MATRICLDAGHGGKEPGAVGDRLTEAEVTLRISNLVMVELMKRGYLVSLTRPDHNYVSISGRIRKCNSTGSNLFVSVHCNASENEKAEGMEVWYHDGSEKGKLAAKHVHDNIIKAIKIKDRGIRADSENERFSRGIPVLRDTYCPAILIEVEFISNPAGENNLDDRDYLTKYAKAIAEGILDYFGK
jgi:N-acetylmuramoyl-L-alanine amidase